MKETSHIFCNMAVMSYYTVLASKLRENHTHCNNCQRLLPLTGGQKEIMTSGVSDTTKLRHRRSRQPKQQNQKTF